MGDANYHIAALYAASMRRQAEGIRSDVVERAHALRESVRNHDAAFSGLARSEFETAAEDDLSRTERELRHAADMIAMLRGEITRKRVLKLIAAE